MGVAPKAAANPLSEAKAPPPCVGLAGVKACDWLLDWGKPPDWPFNGGKAVDVFTGGNGAFPKFDGGNADVEFEGNADWLFDGKAFEFGLEGGKPLDGGNARLPELDEAAERDINNMNNTHVYQD